ncbi:hypothetical protein FRC03_001510 [Tulasnella sp. 419]|nr:hypothetical protein FRC03_001510 [Tulasnella sp. 419]
MKLTTPLPQPLPQECIKATKILRSFLTPARTGPDKVIPRHVLQNARGFALFTVMKAGFVFSARAGSGVVIAKLDDGSWSPPSAIGTAGMGFGGQAGAEITEFLIVLNSRAAVKSFMSAGSLTLGGNMSLALGPLGRNGEASGSLNTKGTVAAMYSYSKTKGLFGGVSLEGSVIVERQDANAIAYGSDVTAKQLLSGNFPMPHWADGLIQALRDATGEIPGWINDQRPASSPAGRPPTQYSFSGMGSTPSPFENTKRKKSLSISSPLGSWGRKKSTSTSDYFSPGGNDSFDYDRGFDDKYKSKNRSTSPDPTSYNAPYQPRNLMDDDSDDAWGDKPIQPRAQTTYRPPAAATNSYFPVHFDSDFVHSEPKGGSTSTSRNTQANDPFPDLNTSMNAFSFSSTQPPKLNTTMQERSWKDDVGQFSGPTPPLDSPPFGGSDGLSSPRSSLSHTSKPIRPLSARRGLTEPAPAGTTKAIALFDYLAKEPGDLSFHRGDVIYVVEKTETTNDWWRGRLAGEYNAEGIFPANFVSLDV